MHTNNAGLGMVVVLLPTLPSVVEPGWSLLGIRRDILASDIKSIVLGSITRNRAIDCLAAIMHVTCSLSTLPPGFHGSLTSIVQNFESGLRKPIFCHALTICAAGDDDS